MEKMNVSNSSDHKLPFRSLGIVYIVIAIVLLIVSIIAMAASSFYSVMSVMVMPILLFGLNSYCLFSKRFYIISLALLEIYLICFAPFIFGFDLCPVILPVAVLNGMVIYILRKDGK